VASLGAEQSSRAGDAVRAFDDAFDRAFDRIRGPAVDRVAYALSSAADHSALWHGLGIVEGILHRDRRFVRRFSTAMGIESFLTNVVVKSAFQRIRPPRPPDTPMLYGLRQPITSSFPSGHATAAFCAATLLARESNMAAPWYALATVVALTRVYVRLHHASDIVAGAALGLALGRLMAPAVATRKARS
jgi:undecaprenyl-diphosphatase